jgi:hypothetical protein
MLDINNASGMQKFADYEQIGISKHKDLCQMLQILFNVICLQFCME